MEVGRGSMEVGRGSMEVGRGSMEVVATQVATTYIGGCTTIITMY